MPAARVRRVAIVGAASSGKSTLAQALAAHYQTLWVPEYLREFVDTCQRTPQAHEQILIAGTQVRREMLIAQTLEATPPAADGAPHWLFCDTTPSTTKIYSDFYFGGPDAATAQLAREHRYDVTLVTAPDIAWTADGLQRDGAVSREALHDAVLALLTASQTPYLLVSGSVAERVALAADYLRSRTAPTP